VPDAPRSDVRQARQLFQVRHGAGEERPMTLHIRNMVCSRCSMVVENELKAAGLHPTAVELGKATVEEDLSADQKEELNQRLQRFGFELIDDRKSMLIEKIKNEIVKAVHHAAQPLWENLSKYLSRQLHHDYTHLSNLFSETQGTTIEKYYINQKIEKAKELLVYDELNVSEIAEQLGYATVAHFSNQFKQVTGFSPSHFKRLGNAKRRPLENI
jgi:AraC-like DNA-binding protein